MERSYWDIEKLEISEGDSYAYEENLLGTSTSKQYQVTGTYPVSREIEVYS